MPDRLAAILAAAMFIVLLLAGGYVLISNSVTNAQQRWAIEAKAREDACAAHTMAVVNGVSGYGKGSTRFFACKNADGQLFMFEKRDPLGESR